MAPTPTPTVAAPASPVLPRQNQGTTITVVPETTTVTYTSHSLSGGAIAGIVIGSIVGIILLCLLIRWALRRNQGGETVGTPPRHSRHRTTVRHHYSSSRSPHRAHSHSRQYSHSHSPHRSRSRSASHGHYRRSVEVVGGAPAMSEPQRVYVDHSRRGRPGWRD
jgi:hypothetical protein